MERIGILYNPLSPETGALANQLHQWLEGRGISTWCGVSHDAREDPALVAGCDLLVSLGGDGTVLRASRLAIPNRVPLLAVAMGHLSFMAEIEPDDLLPVLQRVLDGHFWVEERTLIDIEHRRSDAVLGRWTALNELLITRAEMIRAVVVAVQIDGAHTTSYHADGVIVATSTGSTAYALAAGGPVLDPRSRGMVMVSVAPHLTSIPSLVLHESAVIRLELESHYPALLGIDGQITVPMQLGDVVVAYRSPQVARFARIGTASSFYQSLTDRLRRA